MATERLATLASVKSWLNIDGTSSDELLTDLLESASGFVLDYLGVNSFSPQDNEVLYDTYGKNWFLLREFPIISVDQVWYQNNMIPKSTGDNKSNPHTNGWSLQTDKQGYGKIVYHNGIFPDMRHAVNVLYRSGYQNSETYTIPASLVVTVGFIWACNVSVKVNNVSFTKVDSSPNQGEYSIDEGSYTFHASDQGKTVVIVYGYVPASLSRAVVELVGEKYRMQDRIGYVSKSLGGQETVTFSKEAMHPSIAAALMPFKKVSVV